MLNIKEKNTELIIKLKVQPGAKNNEITGLWQDMLKVKVTSPAENGRANKACIKLLSKKLGISKVNIDIIRGHTSRQKQISIYGLSKEDLLAKLGL